MDTATHNCDVTFTATVRTMDEEGARPATEAEFTRVFKAIADHLYSRADLVEPDVWGQASTGNLEVRFMLPVCHETAADSAPRRVAQIIDEMNNAAKIVTGFDFQDKLPRHATVIASNPNLNMALV